jgi:hypothetical protein
MATVASQTAALPEGGRFYLLRGTTMVPLVPADQLPFQLRGLPRQLSHRQMSDENWKLLHETKHPALSFAIRVPDSISTTTPSPLPTLSSHSRFLAPDHHVRSSPKDIKDGATQDKRWAAPSNPNHTFPSVPHNFSTVALGTPVSMSDTFASIYRNDAQRFGYHTPYPSGIEPDQSKKEFCTHWIQTGECAFTSVGCKYKHEMPTIDRLRQLGFTQRPKWWKEKSAITAQGPTWMQLRLAGSTKDGNEQGEVSPPRAFPDPSTFRNRQTVSHDLPRGTPLSRCVLQKLDDEVTPRSSMTALPKPEALTRRDSQVSNLLIDFEETPAPPSSPQLSSCSSSTTETFDAQSHSDSTSKSSPPASLLAESIGIATGSGAKVEEPKSKQKKSERMHKLTTRRESLQFRTSDTGDDLTPVKSVAKRVNIPSKGSNRARTPVKQMGLANSRHAATNSDLPKFADACVRNGARKPTQVERNKTISDQKQSHGPPSGRIARGRASRRAASAIVPSVGSAKQVVG